MLKKIDISEITSKAKIGKSYEITAMLVGITNNPNDEDDLFLFFTNNLIVSMKQILAKTMISKETLNRAMQFFIFEYYTITCSIADIKIVKPEITIVIASASKLKIDVDRFNQTNAMNTYDH